MNTAMPGSFHDPRLAEAGAVSESSASAVSWAAIICGAIATLVTMLVLISLGTGFNLLTVSPWPNSGVTATTFTLAAAIGLIVVQWISAGVGGYLAGRLRTRWTGVHTNEVFFRDTAHGFMSWALATLVGMMMVTSAAAFVTSTGADALSNVAGGAAQGASQAAAQTGIGITEYDVDALFRTDRPGTATTPEAMNAQAGRILASGLVNGDVPAADRTYLAQMIAGRTGISQADAEKRVDATIARAKETVQKARQAADTARKAASAMAIFTGIAMLIGAFIASAAAAYGGSLRDDDDVVARRS